MRGGVKYNICHKSEATESYMYNYLYRRGIGWCYPVLYTLLVFDVVYWYTVYRY
jgi:hypothetical protein